ncbi:hypothetical protein [Pseudarthrobacter sp. lyk4-40-TYG-27]|uniref:hypothetical protein n=1 Tax=Pseudarthrobacter sp. lyk4-40-TYG-27 TaxID=3040305 RepID=UPI002556070D|nr:hypothetical protein [Pseudarthrobacter sp. lyk4-40-TYG-27]
MASVAGMDLRDELRRPTGMLEITVSRETGLDEALGQAVDAVSESAEEHRLGIMISRVGLDRYVVRVHPAVPYGLVRQAFT